MSRAALCLVVGALSGWYWYEIATEHAASDLAACRATLAATRDSLRTERADLIACYQSGGWRDSFPSQPWPRVRVAVMTEGDVWRAATLAGRDLAALNDSLRAAKQRRKP